MAIIPRKKCLPFHFYGDMSEQERGDEFVRICGSERRADSLDNLLRSSNPHRGSDTLGRDSLSKSEVFVALARKEGYAEREIGALLCL